MPELIITNARALTQNPALPTAEAVAITGNRFSFVGSEADALQRRSADTVVIDAGGKTVLPGIIDSHFHLLWGSLRLGDIALEGVSGLAALRNTISAYREAHPDKRSLRGQGLSYDILPGERLHRCHLDEIVSDAPLILTCFDFHTIWCNTAALEAAGILHGADLPPGSEVVLDRDGLATGELREFGAMDLVYALIPEPSTGEQQALLKKGLERVSSYGITSVHNMNGDSAEFALYRGLDEAGALPLRLCVPYRITPEMPLEVVTEAAELRDSYRSDKLRAGAFKLFMDGVVESFTAFLLEPYVLSDSSAATCGEALFSAEHFTELALRADRAGLQIAVHAVGDAAVRRTLDGLEVAARTNGKRDSRHRIEHIELLNPDDQTRFAELGVVASMQPFHCTRPETDYLPSWLRYVPETRYNDSFPWQTLRGAGAHLCFGSDWPVVSMNPFLGFDAARNRQPWLPGLPDQAQTLSQTLAAYTRDAAYTEFAEHDKGQLKVGMLADLVVLSEDITQIQPEQIVGLEATLTVCGGQVVFQR